MGAILLAKNQGSRESTGGGRKVLINVQKKSQSLEKDIKKPAKELNMERLSRASLYSWEYNIISHIRIKVYVWKVSV